MFFVINPWCACAARVTVVVLCVCLSVCLLLYIFSSVRSSHKRYDLPNGQWRSELSNSFLWKCPVAKLERFHHCTANGSSRHFIAAESAHAHRLNLVRLLCVSWRHKKTQRRACIDSRILSTAVASPCKTLRELLAGETTSKRILNSPAHQLVVPRMWSSPRVCTSVLCILSMNAKMELLFFARLKSYTRTNATHFWWAKPPSNCCVSYSCPAAVRRLDWLASLAN